MAERPFRLLRARVVLPVRRPPIADGAVGIAGNRLVAVGAWRGLRRRFSGKALDLGECILLPGLVNAHCHLDYTGMAGLFPPPRSFCEWIKCITAEKAAWSDADFARSWREGAGMLLRSGTTTVADMEAVPALLPAAWEATPLRVISFLEMTGIRSRRDPAAILNETIAKIDSLPPGRCRATLSPHAPYSTVPELMRRSAAAARKRSWLVTTHLAESAAEFEMFRRGHGEMFKWLARNQRDMSDCGLGSPVQHLERSRVLGPNLLAAHVNYLAPGDAALLARRKVTVVHCPRSHDYFRHRPFPYHTLARAGVRVCLGTDSLATVRTHRRQPVALSLFDEMRAMAATRPGLSPETILRLATVNGAAALGRKGEIGELKAGALADLIAVPFNGLPQNAWEAVVHHLGTVKASMIDGRWVWPPPGK